MGMLEKDLKKKKKGQMLPFLKKKQQKNKNVQHFKE